MAGSPSNVILSGFRKSKLLCLKIDTLSERMDDLLTVSRVGATGKGLNFSNKSLRLTFSLNSQTYLQVALL